MLEETMVKMLRVGFARFDPEKGRFTSFLFFIARCCVIDAIRRRTRGEARDISLNGTLEDCSSHLVNCSPTTPSPRGCG
ncbi:MAG: hypothetical protein H0X04_02065 [Chthoniobacterales bacterium]|nr:hypothetical protein [Chthoniobacterales bacterium]